jgi:hypothetical protein
MFRFQGAVWYNGVLALLTAKDDMKLKTPAVKKEIRTPLVDWQQATYSESALKIMEEATGQRFARVPVRDTPPAPVVAEAK